MVDFRGPQGCTAAALGWPIPFGNFIWEPFGDWKLFCLGSFS